MTSRVESARNFVDTYRVHTPLTLVDTRYALSGHYDVTGVPTWILFDAAGNELARGNRVNGRMEDVVDAALGN